MKNLFTKKALINLGIFCLFATTALSAHTTMAQIPDYTVLAPLPGTTKGECLSSNTNNANCETTLEKYLPGAFNLLIGLAAVFAVLMIVIGGIQYMSSDALSGKEDGKARIENAVKGLVLVISAWLILTTINPDLLKLNLTLDPVTVSAPPAGTSGGSGTGSPAGKPMTEAQKAEDAGIRAMLASSNVDIKVNAPPCTDGQVGGCTNLNGINGSLLNNIVDLRRAVGSTIVITGGTEGGHTGGSSHYTGNAIDLRRPHSALDAFVQKNKVGQSYTDKYGTHYTLNMNGRTMTFLDEGDHWHVENKK